MMITYNQILSCLNNHNCLVKIEKSHLKEFLNSLKQERIVPNKKLFSVTMGSNWLVQLVRIKFFSFITQHKVTKG